MRALLLIILAVSFYIFLKRLLEYMLSSQAGGKAGRPGRRTLEGDEMVQDPHCKVYIPLERSISKKVGGETLHFCSEECAKKYVKEIKQ